MSVESETSSVSYTGNNSTVVAYTVPFLFYKQEHLEVVVTDADDVETPLALTTDFTVSGEGDEDGGTLLTVEAYDNTNTIRITRKLPAKQPFVFEEGQRIPMKTLEKALDYGLMFSQRALREAEDAATLADTAADSSDAAQTAAEAAQEAAEESAAAAEAAEAAVALKAEIAKTVAIDSASTVVVNPEGTDTERGTALQTAYTAAKLLTPNGEALSANNRAQVIIPPGHYKTAAFTLDANYVDLIALSPEKGGNRLATDDDSFAAAVPLSNYRPTSTVIYSDVISVTPVIQTARDVRMVGFTISQLYAGAIPNPETPFTGQTWRAFYINAPGADANDLSRYDSMYFFSRHVTNSAGEYYRQPVGALLNLKGTWRNCIANGYAWRVASAGIFGAAMFDCEFGSNSICGDISGSSMDGCYMERCKSIGIDQDTVVSGSGSWGGCTFFGSPITSTCTFIDCIGGDRCFALSKNCAGVFIRCRVGAKSMGYVTTGQPSGTNFSGSAEDCVAGSGSFGGCESIAAGVGGMNGTMVRCTINGDACTVRRATGAKLRGCRIVRTLTNTNGIRLEDSTSVIQNCEIIVVQGGTGVPISSTSARDVVAASCRFNNATNDADGLGSNVTNLVSSAGNVVSDAIT